MKNFQMGFFLGSGGYIYTDSSSPRKTGDKARLISPKIHGPSCLTFYYHMYGKGMGCLVVYVRKTAKELPLWAKCTNQGNQWKINLVSIVAHETYEVKYDIYI